MMGNVMTPGKYYPGTTFAVGSAWSVAARGAKAGPSWQASKHLQKPHNRKPEKSMRFMKNRLQQKGASEVHDYHDSFWLNSSSLKNHFFR